MDIQDVWNQLIAKIKSYPGVNPSQIDAFFSRIQIQAVSPGFAMFTSNNEFIKDWIERHFIKDIKKALEELYGVDFLVQIEVDTTAEEGADVPFEAPAAAESKSDSALSGVSFTGQTAAEIPQPIAAQPTTVEQPNFATTPSMVDQAEMITAVATQSASTAHSASTNTTTPTEKTTNSLMTFNSFVVGDSNRLAYAMSIEVAERPGTSNLNPLFIYGRSGVGKTHLMCAIKNYINEQYPDLNVIYIDSGELVNLYTEAAREKSIDKLSFKNFENFFKDADVLLIDDIQGLQGKNETINTLFRIFNANIAQGKQFVFSADRSPNNIDLEERYISRFNSGATIDIQPPNNEVKRGITKNFIQQYQQEEGLDFELSDEIIDYIVENSGTNIRELKSAITNVLFAIRVNGEKALTTQDVKNLLANHFINKSGNRFTVEMIQGAVETFYHVSHSDLVSKKRNKSIAHPRQVAIYLCRELITMTYKDIGKAFNRDHSTVMHSIELIEKSLNEDRNLREEIEAIREMLRNQEF